MWKRTLALVTLAGFLILTQACSGSGQPDAGAPDTQSAAVAAAAPQAPVPEPVASPAPPKPRPAATPAPTPAPIPAATPAPIPSPTPAPASPESKATSSQPADAHPGEVIEVGGTKPGLSRVGALKCKMCHRVQYESWSASVHAKSTPPLDCESCHGPGSRYSTLPVMKDPAKAREAGLLIPATSFCTGRCHQKDWKDEMLARAHAHKAK